MDRYASGEAGAFTELYDLLAPRLCGYLLRQTRDPSRTEDLLQQTMLHIHCARGRFVRGARVVPWAFSIARRLFIDGLRRRKFEGPVPTYDDGRDAAAHLEANDRAADDAVYAAEIAILIRRELEHLPEAQRDAFDLVKHDGLTLAEAAEALGTTVMAIKMRNHRTYVALRAALGGIIETDNI
jgi:RNA polymerase sigma-70 factor (ECF subfamily)